MPVIVRARKSDSSNDVIRKFKKAAAASGVVQTVKDRRYFQKPSKGKSSKTAEYNRLRRRSRSLKKRKNISGTVIEKINQRLNKGI